jgi:3-dehydroquinate synthase
MTETAMTEIVMTETATTETAMTKIEVQLQPRYTVHVGKNLLETVQVPHARVALLADANVLETFAPKLAASLERGGSSVSIHALPAGEGSKTLLVHAQMLSEFARERLTRDAAVVSLGGGATSDLSGYVAASYLRGIAFYAVPTTLLAMVDASVGGKTGVNLPEGKNLVGAFHQPRGVWASLETLETLPEAAFREGAAETFKHGLLANPSLCDRVLEPGFKSKPMWSLETRTRPTNAPTSILVTRWHTRSRHSRTIGFRTAMRSVTACTTLRFSRGLPVAMT